jgi:hypothetical protein
MVGAHDCEPLSPAELFQLADVVVDGVFLEGPVDHRSGTLLSPAAFSVERYVKGAGAERLQVQTQVFATGVGAESIAPAPGERWRIYGGWRDPAGPLVFTSTCAGSTPLPG